MDFTKKDSLALKGIAILMMYVHHFYLSPERWAGYTVDFFPLTESMTVYLAEFLKTCVCVFVFITGYGMTQSLKQKHPDFRPSSTDMLSYTRHRLVSLLSNFIFVYLLVILVSFPTGRFFEIYGRSGSSILYVLVDMFGLAKLFKTPSYVGTWWYMSLAIVLVVLFPLFVKLYREYRWAFLFAVMLLPRFLNLRVVNTNLLHYTLAMALGMYCAESDLFTRWKTFEETRLRKIPKILLFLFQLLLLAALVVPPDKLIARKRGFGKGKIALYGDHERVVSHPLAARVEHAARAVERYFIFVQRKTGIDGRKLKNIGFVDLPDLVSAALCVEPADERLPLFRHGQ